MTLSLPALILLVHRAAAASQTGPVQIEVPATPPEEGQAIAFGVHETVDGPVFIDGCAPLEIERKTGGKWLTTAVKVCDSQVPATQLDGDLAFSIPGPASGSGAYRVILTWGTGCAPGFPLTTAICEQMGSVTSEPFVVAPKTK